MFKNTYLGNSDNGLFVVFSRMNGDKEELDVSIADLICYAGKRPIILWKDGNAYSLTKVESSYDAQNDKTTVVAVFGENGYKVVVDGWVNSGSKGTLVYDAASSGGGSTGGGLLVVYQDENYTLDHTLQEIFDSPFTVLDLSDEPDTVKSFAILEGVTNEEGEEYSCTFRQGTMQRYYLAQSADGYPTYTE